MLMIAERTLHPLLYAIPNNRQIIKNKKISFHIFFLLPPKTILWAYTQIIEDKIAIHSQITGVFLSTMPFSYNIISIANTKNTNTIKILKTGNIFGTFFNVTSLINITVCKTMTPKKYNPIPALWIVGAILNGLARIYHFSLTNFSL